MPLYNFEDVYSIITSTIFKAVILEIDVFKEVAKIECSTTSSGEGKIFEDVPFYYHCHHSAKALSNGGLESGYRAFLVGDEVLVLFDKSLKPVHIVGLVKGKRPCCMIYFVDGVKGSFNNLTVWLPRVVCKVVDLSTGSILKSSMSVVNMSYELGSDDGISDIKMYYGDPISGERVEFGTFTNSRRYSVLNNLSTAYVGYSHSDCFGKVVHVAWSTTGWCFPNREDALLGVFGYGGLSQKWLGSGIPPEDRFFMATSKLSATFNTDTKVWSVIPTAQERSGCCGSKATKLNYIQRSQIQMTGDLNKYTVVYDKDANGLYQDHSKDPCSWTNYYPFASLGTFSIYVKETRSDYPYITNNTCSGGFSVEGNTHTSGTIGITCNDDPGTIWIVGREIIKTYYYKDSDLGNELFVGNIGIDKVGTSGDISYLELDLQCASYSMYSTCSVDRSCTGQYRVPGGTYSNPATSITIVNLSNISSDRGGIRYKTLNPVAYDGFVSSDGNIWCIMLYSEIEQRYYVTYPINKWRMSLSAWSTFVEYEFTGNVSLYEREQLIQRTYTITSKLVVIMKSSVVLNTTLGMISGEYQTSNYSGIRNDSVDRFLPAAGSIPTCFNCQISSDIAVYTYLRYDGPYLKGLESNNQPFLKGSTRITGIITKSGGHKVYTNNEDEIYMNKTKDQDLSVNLLSNLAVGVYPNHRGI